jgi:hypothetical protein
LDQIQILRGLKLTVLSSLFSCLNSSTVLNCCRTTLDRERSGRGGGIGLFGLFDIIVTGCLLEDGATLMRAEPN